MTAVSKNTKYAAQLLTSGEVIGFPTETVYGLAGNIFNPSAINKIFEIKKRPLHNPLIVHIRGWEHVETVSAEFPIAAKKLALKFWPGPLTLLLRKSSIVPDIVTAGKTTVAVRMPKHRMALAVLKMLDFPLAAPSANPFGSVSPTTAFHVAEYFKKKLPFVLDGGICEAGVESTIIGFEGDEPVLYRYGAIPMEEIERVVGKVRIHNKNESSPEAPGMLSKHYAPNTPTYLTANPLDLVIKSRGRKIGVVMFSKPIESSSIAEQIILSPAGCMKEAASRLYASLHYLDKQRLDLIVAERFPGKGLGITINDRLERASKRI